MYCAKAAPAPRARWIACESWLRRPMHHGERTLSEPEMQIWTPSNNLAQSRRRGSSAPQVLGCQWVALKPWCCGCQITVFGLPAIRSLIAPGARRDLAVASPDTRRTLAVAPLIGDKRCYGECPARRRRDCRLDPRDWAGRVAVGEGPKAGLWGNQTGLVAAEHPLHLPAKSRVGARRGSCWPSFVTGDRIPYSITVRRWRT